MESVLLQLVFVLSSLSLTINDIKAEEIKIDKTTFASMPIELQKIALCESGGKHDIKGKTIKSKTGDLGIMQISEKYHGISAKNLQLNLHNPNDNMKFALWLYEKEGLRPWKASRKCWQN